MALTIPTHLNLKLKPPNIVNHQFFPTHVQVNSRNSTKTTLKKHVRTYFSRFYTHKRKYNYYPFTKACTDGGSEAYTNSHDSSSSKVDESKESSLTTTSDEYVALFIRMLGLDNDPMDREQAIIAIWKYSLGGKKYIDNIMQFHGAINLTVNLLKSESDSTCEAAAGLLRTISSINQYKDIIASSGAIEEITYLLTNSSISSNVKEQSLCTLSNLSVDEKLRVRIGKSDILGLVIKFLEDEDLKVKESTGGVLANLALSESNHKIMVEAGVIQKLAMFLTNESEGSKIIRNSARNILLELSKDEYNKILFIEQGILMVPLIGPKSYKSFRPALYTYPSLPDGTKLAQISNKPSRFGASELLLGLNIQEKNTKLEEIKENAIIGRTQQRFLARIGAIEMEDDVMNLNRGFTFLPLNDGVARLVLMLELEDELAISKGAECIGDVCINEYIRVLFMEGGAVKLLVQLVNHTCLDVRFFVVRALERLSISNIVCQRIKAEGVLYPLLNLFKQSDLSENLTEPILSILTRILDSSKDIEELLDYEVIGRVIEIFKTSSSTNLQCKAASIIEFSAENEAFREKIVSLDIESGLINIFQHKTLNELEPDMESENPELYALKVEEISNLISSASQLLIKLLDFKIFTEKINSIHFTNLLREILKSNISLHTKDLIASCLTKLTPSNEVNIEVTLYETIPRLIEEMGPTYSPEIQEKAVMELNKIVLEGVVDPTKAIANQGGIFRLVEVIENGSDKAIEAGLGVLYSLSKDGENHAIIISSGVVSILKRIVKSQRSDWVLALSVLRNLPV